MIEPSGSTEPTELKATASGALPDDTSELATAVGRTLKNESMSTVFTSLSPLSSVTISVAV